MVFLAKKIIAIILGVLNVALLAVILVSLITGWRIKNPDENSNNNPTEQTSSAGEQSTKTPETQPSTQKPTSAPTQKPTQAVTQKPTQKASEKTTQADTQKSTQKASEKPTQAATQAVTDTEPVHTPDAESLSTSDYPSLADVQDFKFNVQTGKHNWSLPSSAVKLDEVSSVLGGWKAYMLTADGDDVTKHLFNINISASQNGTKLVCTWYYVLLGSENKTQDDNTPPSTFNGSWSDGTITATGTGKITLKDFYYDGSKEYAVGEFMWPDGTTAAIALVRP